MTRQRALRLAREWSQGHVCSLRDGEAAEYHSMFAAMLEESPPNEALTLEDLMRMDGAPVWLDVAGGMWALVDALDGCLWLDRGGSIDIAKFAGKAYRNRPPEGEK